MTLEAGFAEVDISPAPGTAKVGWLKHITIERVADPLYARAAVLRGDGEQIGFIQLDTLSVRWSTTQAIRERIAREHGFPGDRIMVSATHNHAGPAVANIGLVKRDEAYLESLVQSCVDAFRQAIERARPATVGFARKAVFGLSFNRRVVLRNGITRTHSNFTVNDPPALCTEGPIDPELAILAARDRDGHLLGALVNFTCHPTHHGGDAIASAGWPGVLADALKQAGCPVPMLLNGAAGDIHHSDPVSEVNLSMAELGEGLAQHARELLEQMTFRSSMRFGGASTTVQLDHRTPTEAEQRGTVRGAQRFVDPAIYDQLMPHLVQRIAERPRQPAEVQALLADEVAFVSIPAEYFCLLGLRIKERTHPRHTLIVGFANGMVGYVPTAEAFERGGYETTFAPSSRLAPDAGDRLADAAVDLLAQQEETAPVTR